MENNDTIKIISWNVNAFCKTEKWDKLGKEELLNKQNKNSNEILSGIKGLLEKTGENGVLFLQEIPKNLVQNLDNLSELFSDYKFEKNFDKKYPNTSTIAIYKNDDKIKWKNIPFNTSKALYRKRESLYYYNRCVLLESDLFQIQMLGVHIPSVYHDPSALLLWDDIIEFARMKEPHIIIGDFNADAENTPQWRCMKELMNLDKRQYNYYPKRNSKYASYVEAEGEAKKKKEGEPKTYHYENEKGKEEGSHVDYALIRKDSKPKFKVEKYSILTEYKDLSDHYPIMLEIKLNDDKKEA